MKNLDNEREIKWSQPRIRYSAVNPYVDPGIDFSNSPSLTDQSQSAECDINNILKKFQKTGVLPGVDVPQVFADVSSAPDYQTALNIVMHAEEQFNSLDAYARLKFANDPANFLAFAADPNNAQEMVKLGLATLVAPSDTDRLINAIQSSQANQDDDAQAQEAPKQSGPKKVR